MPRIGRYGSIVILVLVLMVSHCSTANKSGILTGVTYSDTLIHRYTNGTHLYASTEQTGPQITESYLKPLVDTDPRTF